MQTGCVSLCAWYPENSASIQVLRGYHFGDVAVKFLNMDHIEESRRLDEFKAEVTAHKVPVPLISYRYFSNLRGLRILGTTTSFCSSGSASMLINLA